jgi:hypothetical protein
MISLKNIMNESKKKPLKESILASVLLPISIYVLKYIAEGGLKNTMKDITYKLGKTYGDIKFNLSRIGKFINEFHKSSSVIKDFSNILHSIHKSGGINYSETNQIIDKLVKSSSVVDLVNKYKIQPKELDIIKDQLKTFMRSPDFETFAKSKLNVSENMTGLASARGQGYDYKGELVKNRTTDIGKSGESMLEPTILDISDEDSSYDPINAGDYDELNYDSPIYMNPNV